MAEQTPELAVNFIREGTSLKIEPQVSNAGGSTLGYELEIRVSQAGSTSVTTQSGYSAIPDDSPTVLTHSSTSFNDHRQCAVKLRVTKGERAVAEIEERYP